MPCWGNRGLNDGHGVSHVSNTSQPSPYRTNLQYVTHLSPYKYFSRYPGLYVSYCHHGPVHDPTMLLFTEYRIPGVFPSPSHRFRGRTRRGNSKKTHNIMPDSTGSSAATSPHTDTCVVRVVKPAALQNN